MVPRRDGQAGVDPQGVNVSQQAIEKDLREHWLEQRRKHITGTDLAKILGVSRFGGPMDVYLDKRGLAQDSDSQAKRAGRHFERAILTMYADEMGEPIEFARPYELIECPAFPLLAVSLDARRAQGDRRPVDAKNVRVKGPDWGEPGTDQFPVYYVTQLVAQMACVEAPAADLAVVFSGQDFAPYHLDRDIGLEITVLREAELFWENHVLAGVPPAVDGSDSWSRYLASRRQSLADTLDSTPDLDEWACRLVEARRLIEAAEAKEVLAANHIKAAIGEHAGIKGAGWQATYRAAKDTEKTDWQAVARALNPPAELIAKHTEVKPGSRRFLFRGE